MAHPDYAQFRPPPEPLDRPVWIDLAQLYGPPRPDPPPPRTGSIRDQMRHSLDLGRRVPGMLRWWVRSVDGRWLGLCDFTIPDVGGATVIRQEGVAVPADALEPRPEERRRQRDQLRRPGIDTVASILFIRTMSGRGTCCELVICRCRVPFSGMAVTEAEIARIPVGNLRVSRAEFAAVWIAADARDLDSGARGFCDWYAGGVRCTCMWLAGAIFRPPWGRPEPAMAPVTKTHATAYEELIEAECVAAELLAQRQPWLLDQRPGWCEAVRATLLWAWRHQGPPPLDLDPAGSRRATAARPVG